MENENQVSIKSLILLWAFAETSIGGVLHALKLPFTGILVGGIAVISIALIGFYQKPGTNEILRALIIVLMAKLLVSPHSPWQAYIAVAFQGYIGSLIYRSNSNFKVKTMMFATLALFESAIQKLLVALIIFGNDFFSSLDIAANSVVGSMGWNPEFSFVYTVFGTYIFLHLLTGIILGFWIPRIPDDVAGFRMPELDFDPVTSETKMKKYKKRIWITTGVFIAILLTLKWLIPDTPSMVLVYMFVRALLISLILVFVVGPLIKNWVKRWIQRKNIDATSWNDIIDMLPRFSLKAFAVLKYVQQQFSGLARIRYFLLGIIVVSAKEVNDTWQK